MSVQLFAKLQGSQEFVNLDLSAAEPIKMVLSVANIEDPLATTSSFSRTFKVPHTGVNGPYFKGVFSVNSVDFDAAKRADAYILDNGQFFANGQIILNSIYRNEKEKNVEYEITFLGETSDFGAKIGGGFMNQINMNHLNHAKDYQNINTSWTGGLFNGDVVYGLIEWGYTYNANNQPVQPTLSNGFAKSFTNINNPLKLSQWKPQYRAKAIWDQVFKEAGYTYDSTFLDSSIFKQLYIISDNVSAAELNTANTFSVNLGGCQGNFTNDSFPIDFSVETSDPGNNFNLTTNAYTAPVTGLYQFEFNGVAALGGYYDNFASSANGSIEWVDQNGTVLGSIPFNVSNQGSNDPWATNISSVSIIDIIQVQLNAGDVVTMRCVIGPGQPNTIQYFQLCQSVWDCTLAPQVLSATGILPANIKKIDFMKSIINKFRLVFVPSRDIQNHFTITPWKDWILEGTVRDWTSKLDDSKDLKIRPLFQGQSRFQVYKDQEDADYLNYNYQLTYKQTFGQLNFDSNNELLTGSKEYKDQFAPTPIAPIGFKEGDIGGSRFLIPHMAKDTGGSEDSVGTSVISGKREPIQPKLRLVFYNGMVPAPVNWFMASNDDGSLKVERTTYPLMSQYNQWPVTPTTLDLAWQNENPFWKITDTYLGNGQTPLSCYNVYWKTWNDQVFDPYSRIIEANITLDYNDVLDLKFNDYIYLKDSWYVVNKINDYIPGQVTNCRVELVKLGNIGVTIPNVSPTVYIPVQLCSGKVNVYTPCEIFCCNNQISTSATYYIPEGTTFATTTLLFLDQNGTIAAPAGIYSDGVNINEFDVTGLLITTYNPADCDCIPDVYSFELIRTKGEPCDICCGTVSQVALIAYGLNPTFELNTLLWLDTAMTVPIPGGWYSDTTSINTVIQFLGGAAQVSYNCETCNCIEEPVYPHTVRFHPSLVCRACRCGTTISVWTDNPVWDASTKIWANNIGTLPASVGFYNSFGWYLETNGINGDVINSNNCPSCIPCKPKLDFDFVLVTFKQGYTTTATLESSDDGGFNWTTEGVVSILPSDSVTTKTETLSIGIGDIFRITSTTDTIGGSMSATLDVNGSLENQKVLTPNAIITEYRVQVLDTDVLSFELNVDGGESPSNNDIIVGGQFTTYKGTGFPPSNTQLRAILGLRENGDVNTDFAVGDGGLKRLNNTQSGFIWDIKRVGSQFLLAGEFQTYKNIDCTNGLVLLNPDGSIDDNFNSTVGLQPSASPAGRWVDVNNGIAYIGGQFDYWDRAPLGSTTPDLYTASPKMVAINLVDGSLNTGFNSQFNPATSVIIEVVKVHENKIYVGGNMLIYGSDTRRWLYRLNLDGSLDTSFNATHLGGNAEDLEFDGDYIWVSGTFGEGIKKINKSDGSNVVWGPTIKFNSSVTSMNLVGDNIYAVGNFTSYNGVAVNRIIAINKDNGGVYSFFDVGSGFNSQVRNSQVTNTHIFCTGDMSTYNGTTTNRIAKIDLATGALDTSFVIGTGFNSTTIGLLAGSGSDINYNCNYKALNYSATSACDAFCNFTIGSQSYWINSPDLLTASLILTDSQCGFGGNGNAPGFYSDGVSVVEVGQGGVIINTIDISGCNCEGGGSGGNKLFTYNVRNAANECEACCSNTLIEVYTDGSTFSQSNIIYTDRDATTFALPGWYTDGISLLYVGNNGAVLTITFCDCDCPPQPCISYRIRNISPSIINFSYTDCSNIFNFGSISPFASLDTTCVELSKLSVTGNYTITQGPIC